MPFIPDVTIPVTQWPVSFHILGKCVQKLMLPISAVTVTYLHNSDPTVRKQVYSLYDIHMNGSIHCTRHIFNSLM